MYSGVIHTNLYLLIGWLRIFLSWCCFPLLCPCCLDVTDTSLSKVACCLNRRDLASWHTLWFGHDFLSGIQYILIWSEYRFYHSRCQIIYCKNNVLKFVWYGIRSQPRWQFSCGPHGAQLGPVGPRWAPCWPHESCYQGGSLYIGWFPMLRWRRHMEHFSALLVRNLRKLLNKYSNRWWFETPICLFDIIVM